jgi:hypothetical protein
MSGHSGQQIDTDRYLVVAKVRDRLAANEKKSHTDFIWKGSISRS